MTLPEDRVEELIMEAFRGLARNNYPLDFCGATETSNGIFIATISDKKLHTLFESSFYPTTYDPDYTVDADIYGKFPEGITDEQRVLFRITWLIRKDWQNNIYNTYIKWINPPEQRDRCWAKAWEWYQGL